MRSPRISEVCEKGTSDVTAQLLPLGVASQGTARPGRPSTR